jgi:type VI protein secretion system component Hcp
MRTKAAAAGLTAVVAVLALGAGSSSAATEVYMTVPRWTTSVTGPSVPPTPPGRGTVKLLSFAWGMSRQSSAFTGGAGGTARPAFDEVKVQKAADGNSPTALMWVAQGYIPGNVLIQFVNTTATGNPVFMKYCLKNASFIHDDVSAGGDETPQETLSLDYTSIVEGFSTQQPGGAFDPFVYGGWNLAANSTNQSSAC